MDTIRKFKKDISEKLKAFLLRGKIFAVNEIAANMMCGIMMMVIILLMVICLILNECGIFTANSSLMRWGVIVSLVIQIPIASINQAYRGDKKWLKYVLLSGLLAQCAILSACLGHNVTLVMVLPIIISTRYFNSRCTGNMIWITYVLFFISSVFTAFLGILNLNVVKLPAGASLQITATLRQAVEAELGSRSSYFISYLINDMLPRFIIFAVIGFTCHKIAKRGREMIDLHIAYTEKSSRIETELNLANEIQTGMLPCIFPAFPKFGELQLYAKNIPAKEVGGDFYDYFQIDDDSVALVMADVSGKGVGAALFMTISKIVIKNLLQSKLSPAETMTRANEQLCENNEAGLFVTTWIGIYNSATETLTYTNAGHNPPIIVKKNGEGYYLKGRSGFVLAGMDGVVYKEESISLEKGDELFLYTDGVTEATDSNNQLYGDMRLLDTVKRIYKKTAEEQIMAVYDDINDFIKGAEQFDDITMMAMKILNNP